MKGFLKPKLIFGVVTAVMLVAVIAIPLLGNITRSHAAAPSEQHNIVPSTSQIAKDPSGIMIFMMTTDVPCSAGPPTPITPTFHRGDLVSGFAELTTADLSEEAPEGESLLLTDTAGKFTPLTIDFTGGKVPFSFTSTVNNDQLLACIQGGPGGDELAKISGTITSAPRLDFTTTRVCEPSATLKGEDKGADSQCSLSDDITVPDKVIGCGLEIGATVLADFLKAVKAKRLVDVLEHEEFVRSEASLATARTNFELIVDALGFVLPTECITGLADLITGGQYTALEMCLADAACTKLLKEELGLSSSAVKQNAVAVNKKQ